MLKGFEYNDEIYSEQEGGKPSCIFFSREDAELKSKELNIKEYKENSLSDYSYGIEDLLSVSLDEYLEFLKSLDDKYGKFESTNKWETVENRLHPKANQEESETYYKMTSLRFYDVYETDIDKSSLRNEKIKQVIS